LVDGYFALLICSAGSADSEEKYDAEEGKWILSSLVTGDFRGRFFAACFTASLDYAEFDNVARATHTRSTFSPLRQ